MSRFDETMGGSPVISCEGREVLRARVFDRSFNGVSFDAHDGPVRCCRAVPHRAKTVRVAAHETSGGKLLAVWITQSVCSFSCMRNSWQSRQRHAQQ